MHKFHKFAVLASLLTLIILGFVFRLNGILASHSFWADEALSASFARDIVLGKTGIVQGAITIAYQPLHVITMAIFMKIFGISEFAARLPAVIFGSLGILFAYLVAEKLSNKSGGLLAAFLFTFSQLNLANTTQAKATAALQTITLIIIYLLIIIPTVSKKKKILVHSLILISIVLGTLFHFLGALLGLIYLTYLFFITNNIFLKLLMLLAFFIGILLYQRAGVSVGVFNNTIYFKNLFLRQYAIFMVPAVISVFFLYKKYRAITLAVFVYSVVLLLWWNFQSYSHNLRYIVPFFGILFVLAGIGVAKIGELVFKKNFLIIISIAFFFLVIAQSKLNLKPQSYYNPNKDFYGDVQIADYKQFYAKLDKKFPSLSGVVIYNDILDAQRWYMKKQSDAYFSKGVDKPLIHRITGKKIYGNLSDFLTLMKKNRKGLLIVEDWESILPEDIKQYAKKNLKLELRVESLPDAKEDPWPLELYSWGL